MGMEREGGGGGWTEREKKGCAKGQNGGETDRLRQRQRQRDIER